MCDDCLDAAYEQVEEMEQEIVRFKSEISERDTNILKLVTVLKDVLDISQEDFDLTWDSPCEEAAKYSQALVDIQDRIYDFAPDIDDE